MTLIHHGRGPNPLVGFIVDPAAIAYVGGDLQRPECILAERDGTLWSADARGGVMRIDPANPGETIRVPIDKCTPVREFTLATENYTEPLERFAFTRCLKRFTRRDCVFRSLWVFPQVSPAQTIAF